MLHAKSGSAQRTAFRWLLVLGMAASAGRMLCAQVPTYKAGDYPAPRYPTLPQHISVDDLMPAARAIVQRDSPGSHLVLPGYGIKRGDKVLLVVAPDHDVRVLDALRRAIQEVGASASILIGPDRPPPGDGAAEFVVEFNAANFGLVSTGGISGSTQSAIATAGHYNVIISGEIAINLPVEQRGKVRTAVLPWVFADQMMASETSLPAELLKRIDDTVSRQVKMAVAFHATDPEGTDLSWPASPGIWDGTSVFNDAGHLNIRGINRLGEVSKPGYVGATGVIAGTWSHTGPAPYVRLTLKNDHVERIEGTGPYADKWREMAQRYKDVTWPSKQGPGLFSWLFEAALGTNPREFRPNDALQRVTGSWNERLRTGVVHWGIGAGISDADSPIPSEGDTSQTAKFLRQHPETPTGHVHLHNYFLTVEMTLPDGSKKLLIEKGHLMALDDPEVRKEAAKFGDPNKLLRESWIPSIPGINVPGDYLKDYANDPAGYFRKNSAPLHKVSINH